MNLRDIIFNKLKERDELDLWPKVRIEIFSMENQEVCDEYLKLYESGYKCKNDINSWVAYILGICDDKPNGEMKVIKTPKLADIDSDFDKEKREEVIELVEDWFKKENVSHISTYGQYRLKMAIQNVLKYKMSERGEDSNVAISISSKISSAIDDLPVTSDQKLELAIEENQELALYLNKYPEEKELILGVIGAYSNIGMHAAGIVIGPEPIYKIAPIAATSKGAVTAMDKEDIESMGLVKFDFLGLANITSVSKCLSLIKERYGKDIDLSKEVDLTDKKCLDRFNAGDVDTIFQFETASFQEILTNQVQVDNFDDLVLIVSINRPGPKKFVSDAFYEKYRTKEPDSDGNIDPEKSPVGTYSTNKKFPSSINYPHPLLKPILQETYGIPVYQEQIMKMAQTLSGVSMTEADNLRAAIGKKKAELFEKCIKIFAEGCRKNNIEEAVIEEVISLMKRFGKYGFNKSHATAYTTLGFWNMWLKTYYPAEWYASVLSTEFSETNSKKKMLEPCYVRGTSVAGKFKQEFKRKLDWYIYGASSGGFNGKYKKCQIYSPSLNISHYKKAIPTKIKGEDRVYLPFSVIEGLGSNTKTIIENKKLLPNGKYENMKDFVEFSGISQTLAIKLIDNDVFEDDFGDNKNKLMADFNHYLQVKQEEKKALLQRSKKTNSEVDRDMKDILFGDFKGVNSIQLLPTESNNIVKKNKKKINIDSSWF